jgi:hypothetical protein
MKKHGSVASTMLRKTLEIDVGPSEFTTVTGGVFAKDDPTQNTGATGIWCWQISKQSERAASGLTKSGHRAATRHRGMAVPPCSAASIGVPGSLHERGVPRRPCDSAGGGD